MHFVNGFAATIQIKFSFLTNMVIVEKGVIHLIHLYLNLKISRRRTKHNFGPWIEQIKLVVGHTNALKSVQNIVLPC